MIMRFGRKNENAHISRKKMKELVYSRGYQSPARRWIRHAELVNLENDIASEKWLWNQNAFIKIINLGVILLEKECSIH